MLSVEFLRVDCAKVRYFSQLSWGGDHRKEGPYLPLHRVTSFRILDMSAQLVIYTAYINIKQFRQSHLKIVCPLGCVCNFFSGIFVSHVFWTNVKTRRRIFYYFYKYLLTLLYKNIPIHNKSSALPSNAHMASYV